MAQREKCRDAGARLGILHDLCATGGVPPKLYTQERGNAAPSRPNKEIQPRHGARLAKRQLASPWLDEQVLRRPPASRLRSSAPSPSERRRNFAISLAR